MRKKKTSPWLKTVVTLLGLLLLTGTILIPSYILPEFIRVTKISCESQYGPCSNNLNDSLQKPVNQKIKQVQNDIDNILVNDVRVTQYSTQFQFPNEIQVYVVERKPKYSVRSDSQNGILLVGDGGQVLGISEGTNLPTVVVAGSLENVGETVDINTHFSLELIFDIYSAYQVQSGKVEDSSFVVRLDDGIKVIFPMQGDREVLMGSLNLILSRLNSISEESKIEEINNIKTIDLRYKNPVLR